MTQTDNLVVSDLDTTYTLNISGVRFVTQVVGTYEDRALLQVLNAGALYLQLVVKIDELKGLKEKLENEVRENAPVGDPVPELPKVSGKKRRTSRKK